MGNSAGPEQHAFICSLRYADKRDGVWNLEVVYIVDLDLGVSILSLVKHWENRAHHNLFAVVFNTIHIAFLVNSTKGVQNLYE